jgi:hypothetical protein
MSICIFHMRMRPSAKPGDRFQKSKMIPKIDFFCHSGEPRIGVRAWPCRVTARGRIRNPEVKLNAGSVITDQIRDRYDDGEIFYKTITL